MEELTIYLLIVNGVLVLITLYYAIVTNMMLNQMKKQEEQMKKNEKEKRAYDQIVQTETQEFRKLRTFILEQGGWSGELPQDTQQRKDVRFFYNILDSIGFFFNYNFLDKEMIQKSLNILVKKSYIKGEKFIKEEHKKNGDNSYLQNFIKMYQDFKFI